MIKLFGVIMIVASSGFLGSYIYRSLKNRSEILKEMLTAMDILQAEIVFKRSSLTDALTAVYSRTGRNSVDFWKGVSGDIAGNMSPQKAFGKNMPRLRQSGITKEDSEVIMSLTSILGKYDSLEQAQMLKNVKELIKVQWIESDNELREKGRLYRALGVSFGIVAALMAV